MKYDYEIIPDKSAVRGVRFRVRDIVSDNAVVSTHDEAHAKLLVHALNHLDVDYMTYMRRTILEEEKFKETEGCLHSAQDWYLAKDGKIRCSECEESKHKKRDIVIVEAPGGVCDGSKLYAYDRTKEDGRGEKLAAVCTGCRACS